jgi:hypothetical protein
VGGAHCNAPGKSASTKAATAILSAMGGPFELAFEKFKPGVEIVLIVRQMPISQQEFAVCHEWVTLLILRPRIA